MRIGSIDGWRVWFYLGAIALVIALAVLGVYDGALRGGG